MAVNYFRRSFRFTKSSSGFGLQEGIKSFRCMASSCLLRNNSDDYVDVTKSTGVIVGMEKMRDLLQEHIGGKKDWLADVAHSPALTVKSQEELIPRCLNDSIQEVIIPLASDSNLTEKYLNFYGHVRIGKLLQDLDTLSVWCGFKYYKGPSERPPFAIVTAMVDNIDFRGCGDLETNQDMKLKGFVSWVGRSSLEVTIFVEQQETSGKWTTKAEAMFIVVARSVNDGSAAFVNKMEPQNEHEKHYFEKGEKNKIKKKDELSASLLKTAPTAKEREIIHDKFLKTLPPDTSSFQSRIKPENTIWMEDTRLKNIVICHPESRNIYNKIFGGFLMKEAFELAWASACIYMKSCPIIANIEDIEFHKPVKIGTLLYFSSIVVYTGSRNVQTRVVAEAYDPKTGKRETTNIFYFNFACEKDIPQVIPKTYGEYILYLDGRRVCLECLRVD